MKCGRDVPHHRSVCQYCGTPVGKAGRAAVSPGYREPAEPIGSQPLPGSAAPASRPGPVVVPRLDYDIRDPGPADRALAWLQLYQTPIDMVLLVLALPIAILAIASSFMIGTMLKIMGSGR